MARYSVIEVRPYRSSDHQPTSASALGFCTLHACGEPAVITMIAEDSAGRRIRLAACKRGGHEYGLTAN
ncbi:MAG: hypothetical protein JO214_09935 [Frankiaceae bacterium]|nr:hypothetical protein [Frankiaceae bacterium]